MDSGADDASTSSVVVEDFPLVKNRRTHRPVRMTFPSRNAAEEFLASIRQKIRRKLPRRWLPLHDSAHFKQIPNEIIIHLKQVDRKIAVTSRNFLAHLLCNEPTGRVLVLINPFSGQKRAEKLWTEHGAHVLRAADIHADVIRTEYPKHATKIIQDLDIDQYDAVLVNSGDGLVTEVICGLLLRKDRERALKFPICHIPGGTSNALAAAICYACK
ncbi:diacylglycerol kinase catalytic domain protein [Ancylostoma caninum]|uniref:Diacylglycerol kinase catalytic domain protein n=1 Tax=Ancylostoma caninum TaxID=29170 RepID=A0A368FKI5_ANCCA|nr:diacylglycerol kinase catalytic domain protein [Ancylostoma caninum]